MTEARMCDQHSLATPQPFGSPLPFEPGAHTGSRRRRLWELPAHTHCPVIGVCLPLGVLRKLVDKSLGGQAVADDYEVHVGAVNECQRRGKLSEALQRELDRRYAQVLRQFAAAKTTDAALALWQQACDRGDIAAALWATLTHPRCDVPAQQRVYRDVHMIQHHAGAAVRTDLYRILGQIEQGQANERELHQLRLRHQQLQSARQAEGEQQQALLMRTRAESIGKDSVIAALRAELAELQQAVPDLAARIGLTQRVAELEERNRQLVRQLGESRSPRMAAEAAPEPEPVRAAEDSGLAVMPIRLHAKAVLCVGGRDGSVSQYRELVEQHGGRFSHHDGGREDNARLLDASLAAADLVICQAGCISHNAYWLVKDHCKRTGKRCVYVDKPSVASFAKSLASLPKDALADVSPPA